MSFCNAYLSDIFNRFTPTQIMYLFNAGYHIKMLSSPLLKCFTEACFFFLSIRLNLAGAGILGHLVFAQVRKSCPCITTLRRISIIDYITNYVYRV